LSFDVLLQCKIVYDSDGELPIK